MKMGSFMTTTPAFIGTKLIKSKGLDTTSAHNPSRRGASCWRRVRAQAAFDRIYFPRAGLTAGSIRRVRFPETKKAFPELAGKAFLLSLQVCIDLEHAPRPNVGSTTATATTAGHVSGSIKIWKMLFHAFHVESPCLESLGKISALH